MFYCLWDVSKAISDSFRKPNTLYMHVNTCKYELNLGECNAQEPFLFFHILEILRDFWKKMERTVHKNNTFCSVILVFCSY